MPVASIFTSKGTNKVPCMTIIIKNYTYRKTVVHVNCWRNVRSGKILWPKTTEIVDK
jgi:hypothetical protein